MEISASSSENALIRRDPRAVALLLAATLTVMAAATISPALPGLQQQFPATDSNAFLIRLLVPAPAIAVVLTAAICGRIADRRGRRGMLLAGVALYALAGSLGALLTDLHMLLASRLILGIALAMIMTAQSALMGDYFTGDRLQALSGAQVSARNLGGLLFITLAGFLAVISPRLPFAIYALPALLLPFFWRVIVEVQRSHDSSTAPLPEPQGWRRRVRLLALGQIAVTVVFFTMPTQLPFYLEFRGYPSPAMTGAALGMMMLAGGIAGLRYSAICGRIGHARVWAVAFGLMAAGFAALAGASGFATVLAGTASIGAGYALAIPGFISLSLAATPAHRRGWTGARLTIAAFLGQFLSPFASMPALVQWGWQACAGGLAVALSGAALLALLLKPRTMAAPTGT